MDRRIASILAFLTLAATFTPASGLAGMRGPSPVALDTFRPVSCESTSLASLDPGSTVETGPLASGEARCVSVSTPEAGLLLLGASVRGEARAEARLVVRACSSELGTPSVEESWLRTPAERILHLSGPSRLLACVRLQEPRHRAESSALRAIFVPEEEMDGLLEPVPDKNQQIEVEPDGLTSGPGASAGLLEPVPDKNQQIEVEPDGLVAPSIPMRWRCPGAGPGLEDDFGDLTACASPLRPGGTVRGHLAGASDLDVFAFRLESLADLSFTMRTREELWLDLLDERGHRLARLTGAGQRTRTLAAGVYFLRISGVQGAGGDFELRLEAR